MVHQKIGRSRHAITYTNGQVYTEILCVKIFCIIWLLSYGKSPNVGTDVIKRTTVAFCCVCVVNATQTTCCYGGACIHISFFLLPIPPSDRIYIFASPLWKQTPSTWKFNTMCRMVSFRVPTCRKPDLWSQNERHSKFQPDTPSLWDIRPSRNKCCDGKSTSLRQEVTQTHEAHCSEAAGRAPGLAAQPPASLAAVKLQQCVYNADHSQFLLAESSLLAECRAARRFVSHGHSDDSGMAYVPW